MSYDITLQNGVDIPQIGLGTYQLKGETCKNSVTTALDAGYRHIDTAEIYGNEDEIGAALSDYDREDVFITSKLWRTHMHHDDAIEAFHASLERLNTDYIDLYLIHRPNSAVPMEETFAALEELYHDDKIRAVGVSNFTITHLEQAQKVSDVPIAVNQVEFHPLLYQEELLTYCKDNDIQLTAYAPIAKNKVAEDATIRTVADKHDKSPAQISIRWVLQHGAVAIPRSSKESHIRENMDVFDFELSDGDMERIGNAPEHRIY